MRHTNYPRTINNNLNMMPNATALNETSHSLPIFLYTAINAHSKALLTLQTYIDLVHKEKRCFI